MASPAELPSLERVTLRERCLALIRERIADGSFPPGKRLVETELSSQLTVSRGTVREALRHLQEEGLVAPDHRGRLRVRVLEAREIEEIFEVREALEGQAAVTIAGSPDRELLMGRLREAADRLVDRGEGLAAWMDADLRFHRMLCELAGNRLLLDTWCGLSVKIRSTILGAGLFSVAPLMSGPRHMSIVDAIATGDQATVRRSVHEHMQSAVVELSAELRARTLAAGEGEGRRRMD